MQTIIDYKFVEDLRGEILADKIEVNMALLKKIKRMPWGTILEIKKVTNGRKIILESINKFLTLKE